MRLASHNQRLLQEKVRQTDSRKFVSGEGPAILREIVCGRSLKNKRRIGAQGLDRSRNLVRKCVMNHVSCSVDHLKSALPDKSVQPHGVGLDFDDLIAPASHDRDWHGKLSIVFFQTGGARHHERRVIGRRSDL